MLTPRSLVAALAFVALAGTARADVFTDHPLTADVVPFDATRPVVVLVHGWDPEPGQMDPLGVELGRRGYSVVRWHWDWRANMEQCAEAFARGMQQLVAEQRLPALRIFTHSQGSLIARRALTTERSVTLAGSVPIRLVSLAAPFGGFLSANGTYFYCAGSAGWRAPRRVPLLVFWRGGCRSAGLRHGGDVSSF
jgi:alpha-beta hydrolase superfamily lysophospholipase